MKNLRVLLFALPVNVSLNTQKTEVYSDGWETDVYSYTSCPNCGNNVNTNQI